MMQKVPIEGLNKPISQLVLGTAHISKENIDSFSPIIDQYIQLGGNTIDTAENYGFGESEKALGEYLQSRGIRDDLVIITKGAHPYDGENRVRPELISEDLLGSLERLQTSFVDIYMLHRDDPAIPVSEIIESLNEHVNKGRIKTLGASNWAFERIQKANEYATRKGLVGFSSSSTNLSLAKPQEPMWPMCVSADFETCKWHSQNQMPLISWAAQAGGFFSGAFSPAKRDNKDMVRVYYNDDNWERLRRAEVLAKNKGVETVQISLAYVLQQPFPTCGVVGLRSLSELESNFEATTIRLSEDEIDWLNLEQ